jgi:hypothetical protein
MRIGITGHQRLEDETAWEWVTDALTEAVMAIPRPLIGLSSLAAGADQLFAQIVLKNGGALEATIPFPAYRERFENDLDARRYDALLAQAAQVEILPARSSDQESYLAAGRRIVDRSAAILAVWNRRPAADVGGTSDVVQYAMSVGRPLTIFDPVNRIVLAPA